MFPLHARRHDRMPFTGDSEGDVTEAGSYNLASEIDLMGDVRHDAVRVAEEPYDMADDFERDSGVFESLLDERFVS